MRFCHPANAPSRTPSFWLALSSWFGSRHSLSLRAALLASALLALGGCGSSSYTPPPPPPLLAPSNLSYQTPTPLLVGVQAQSPSVLAGLHEKLLAWKEQLLPKHPMAEAVNYTLGVCPTEHFQKAF